MKNKFIIIFVVLVFIGSYFAGKFLDQSNLATTSIDQYEKVSMTHKPCNPAFNVCAANIENDMVTMEFLQPPSPLNKFEIRVVTGRLNVEKVMVDFNMKDMNMGLNRVQLDHKGNGVWVASTILPVCTLRRNDWVSQLQLLRQNKLWLADFEFEQKKE